MGKSIAGMVGTQQANWQQLNPNAALGQVMADSTRLRQYRDVKSMVSTVRVLHLQFLKVAGVILAESGALSVSL